MSEEIKSPTFPPLPTSCSRRPKPRSPSSIVGQLVNLQKQAEEAARYKNMSEEIKKIEAGLYYLKLLEIDKEIKIENEINVEAETEVTDFNNKIAGLENLIKTKTEKVRPLREKKIENSVSAQRTERGNRSDPSRQPRTERRGQMS